MCVVYSVLGRIIADFQHKARWIIIRYPALIIEEKPLPAIETQQLTKTFVTREKQPGLRGNVRALFRPVLRETQAVKSITFTVLVFTSRRTGNYDLYLADLATGAETQLTTSPYSDAHPSWAPQGDEIVYTMVVAEGSALLREIGVLNILDPAHPRCITCNVPGAALHRYADWSPDARWVVFTSERDGNEEIYLIPAGGGWAANLTNAPLSSESAPAWSR